MEDPSRLAGPVGKLVSPNLCKGWKRLAGERRALIELLSRCAISEDQALRFYDATERSYAGIDVTNAQLLANPFLLFERDRDSLDPIGFGAVDRGLFPDEVIRREFPVPPLSRIEDPADPRRVRALVADLLEEASSQGHSVLPRGWVIRRARERALQPPCPLGENVLDASEDSFLPVIARVATRTGEAAYQIDRLIACREIIRREVRGRKKGKPHAVAHHWRACGGSGSRSSRLLSDAEGRCSRRAGSALGKGRCAWPAGFAKSRPLRADRAGWHGQDHALRMPC